MKNFFGCAFFGICVVASPALIGAADYETVKNIAYRTEDAADENVRNFCRLDMHYPTEIDSFATVIYFHGGGLSSGKKEIPKELRERGIAVVAPDYRLAPAVQSPVYIQDAAAAVAWTLRNIEQYGGARDRVFVSGHSAGGYLTSMIGLDKRWLDAHGLNADELAGLIPYSGHSITHFQVRKERGIGRKQPVVDDMAPLFHLRQDAPPMLLITGDRDLELLGRYEETAYFWRMMTEVGHPDCELLELEGFNHGQMSKPAHELLLRFIKQRVNGS